MPAATFRRYPPRTMKMCDGTSASEGASFSVGTSVCDCLMWGWDVLTYGRGPRRIQPEAELRDHARAPRRRARQAAAGRRARLLDPEARGLPPALRFPPRAGRRAAQLVGPEGPQPGPARKAPCRARRGSPARLRRLRGDHPEGAIRRRHRAAVGPRHLGAAGESARRLREGKLKVHLEG